MRFAVFVNPGLSVLLLRALSDLDLAPVVVVTSDPRTARGGAGPRARLRALAARAVGRRAQGLEQLGLGHFGNTYLYCLQQGWPVLPSQHLKGPGFAARLAAFDLDLMLVFGFRLIPEEVLRVPRWGALGFHPTLLPAHRGADPIPWTFLDGATADGFTIFRLDAGVDSGPVVLREEVPRAPGDDARSAVLHLCAIAARRMATLALVRSLGVELGETPQAEAAPAGRRPRPADFTIRAGLEAEEIERRVKGAAGLGGAPLEGEDARVVAVLSPWLREAPDAGLPRGLGVRVLPVAGGGSVVLLVRVDPRP